MADNNGADPTQNTDEILRQQLEDWARQTLIVKSAQEELARLATLIQETYGDTRRGIFSENAHIARKKGRRSFDYKQAVMQADIPAERYRLYAKPVKIDWRKMYLGEGLEQGDVPYTQASETIQISLIMIEEN